MSLGESLVDHFDAGKNLFLQGRFDDSKKQILLHLANDPNHAESFHLLALISHHEQEFDEAIRLFEEAIANSPTTGEFYGNLGNTLEVLGIKDRALECYAKAVQLCPQSAELNANYSTMLWNRTNLDEAFKYAQHAIAINPNLPSAQYAMGNACKDLGLIDEALRAYQRAKSLHPGLLPLESGYLYALNYHPALLPSDIANEHRKWASQFAEPLTRSSEPFEIDLSSDRRLRIGYVGNAFRDHAINFFVEPLLRYHDRENFEIYCYSDVIFGDNVTDRLQKLADHWRSLVGLDDTAVAKLIRQDRIDILVDLHGHMGGLRIRTFAMRAAPIQVTYIGYQATTGMSAMDYRLTDANSDPVGLTESLHSEKLYRLNSTFFCYQPPEESPEVTEAPFCRNGYITFGSFNAVNKLSASTLKTWALLLRRMPTSKLRVLVPDSQAIFQRIGMALLSAGAKQSQVEFVIRSKRRRYLERIAEVDIALDPFPFNGHTTSCDALWMGLPVIMLRGKSYVQRYGSSALLAIGLEDLIAENPDHYLEIAVRMATDTKRLSSLRGEMRDRMKSSSIMDYQGFTQRVSEAYRDMWNGYVRGLSPAQLKHSVP